MRTVGRRIHIAGSADAATADALLGYAHALVATLVRALAGARATFLVGVGREPRARPDDPNSPALIFDWTALAAANDALHTGAAQAVGPQGRLIMIMATEKTDQQIPDERRPLWDDLMAAGAVRLEYPEPGWTSGAIRRIRQSQMGDLLIALSGGEGVEHLARLYMQAGKPVIPLDLAIGGSTEPGTGAAARLAAIARAHPERFVRVADPQAATALISRTSTRQGQAPIDEVVAAVTALIAALEPPTAFYVRLLNPDAVEYPDVEDFFRRVVDPAIDRLGYRRIEMGRDAVGYAWMNEAIFDSLHHSAVVVADLTALRPNCFMEYGYALGRGLPVIVTAKKGTHLPFDTSAVDCHLWGDDADDDRRIAAFLDHWRRIIDRPPLVKPRGVL